MAENAKTLVERNGFGGVIEVTQGSVESVELPEKVGRVYGMGCGLRLGCAPAGEKGDRARGFDGDAFRFGKYRGWYTVYYR